MPRPTILFLDIWADGFVLHRRHLALAARAAGWIVHVATPPSPLLATLAADGFVTHAIALSRSGLGVVSELAALAAVHRLFRRVRPDLVHIRTMKPVVYGGIAARLVGVPAVASHVTGLGYAFSTSGLRAEILRAVLRPALRVAFGHRRQRVIFQNPDDRAAVVGLGVVASAKCVLIRGSGVDTEALRPSPLPQGVPMVVLPARLLWDKGVGEFIAAARLLKQRGVPVRCVLVGDVDSGNPTGIPRERLLGWQAEGVIEWWGWRSTMADVYAQASIVCLPSYGEGMPKVLLEGMACGRPVVTTDANGCRTVCRDGHNGLLVPLRDATALADALQRLLADPQLAGLMGARGRERAVGEFSLDRVVRACMAIFTALVPRGARPPAAVAGSPSVR